MKALKRKNRSFYFLLCAAILLIVTGIVLVGRVFNHYNNFFLLRQDEQLLEMAAASDSSLAAQFQNFQTDLDYVLERRGFLQAEKEWQEIGATEDLIFRMQENLISQDELIVAMLAIRDGEVILSTNGRTDYAFPAEAMESNLWPCIAADGSLYLAFVDQTERLTYAALMDLEQYFVRVALTAGGEDIRLMLLGSGGQLLLHQWLGEMHISSVPELNAENCDLQALQLMMDSRSANETATATYHLSNPGEDEVHEMRMAVIPVEKSKNGYFTVGLTGDYDEVISPMQSAAIQLISYGGMTVAGMLMLMSLAVSLVRRSHKSDLELRRLKEKNEETRKLLEKTQELSHHQRLETIGTLASSIAHEFNNLLTPIMGYSILTLEGLPEGCDELCDNITEIYEASRKAKIIISRLSDLSRKNTGLSFRYLSLDDMVRKALEVALPAQPGQVEVDTDLQCGGTWLYGNETQINQLLLNLIINAFHAMERQGGRLTLSTHADETHAILQVKDTGEGIPKEVLPHIFEPFYTTKESGKGTGLGLAIVHQVMESHGGDIQVESVPGQGTTFTARFPLSATEKESLQT